MMLRPNAIKVDRARFVQEEAGKKTLEVLDRHTPHAFPPDNTKAAALILEERGAHDV